MTDTTIDTTIDFNKMIDNYLFREQKPKKVGRYYPSEIGTCMRKLWYSYNYPIETKPDLVKIFHIGNTLHELVVEVLKSDKNPDVSLLQSEFPLQIEIDDFIVSGRIDDLVLIKASGKSILVEVKSCKSIDYIRSAQASHVMQLQLYMHATKVHDGMLLYIDKSTLQCKTFVIPYDETMNIGILERFKNIHGHLKNNTLPIDEAKKVLSMNWLCNFCEYRNKCDKNES